MSAQPAYRALTVEDIPGAQRLRAIAKWNQTDRDWRNLLAFDPQGCFAAEMDGKVVGTATALRYRPASGPGSFGWVGMVLVDPDYRRHGIGSTLLKQCVSHLQNSGVETVKLDATPMGKLVYEKIGFVGEYELERWEGVAKAVPAPSGGVDAVKIETLNKAGIDALAAYDAPIFGAERRAVLGAWVEGWPQMALVARHAGKIAGYALARKGSNFQQIGPVIGDSPAISGALLRQSLTLLQGQAVIVDIVSANPWTVALAEQLGLKQQRPFLRMACGKNSSPGQSRFQLAICCPELG
jgi:GNAT superfamily N-acetyltransferase